MMSWDWMTKAQCVGIDAEAFFPETHSGFTWPIKICQSCPVQAECLEYALIIEDSSPQWGRKGRYGVFGGTTPAQRNKIAKSRGRLDNEVSQMRMASTQ